MSLSADLQEVREFVAYMRLRSLTPRTIIEYQRVVTQFIKRCPPDLESFQDVTFEHLRTYIADLQGQGIAPKSVWDRVVILKRFFGFLVWAGHLDADPSRGLPVPKLGRRLPRTLTVPELGRLFAAMDDTSAPGRRDRVFFHLTYAAGLRMGEARQVRTEDLDWGEGALRVVREGAAAPRKEARRVGGVVRATRSAASTSSRPS